MSEKPAKRDERPELPVLETERLRLRALRPEDAEALYAFTKGPGMKDYLGGPPNKSLEAFRGRVAKRCEQRLDAGPGRYAWIVEEKSTGTLLGEIVLHSINRKQQRGELARGLVAEARGKGYGAEAARAVLDFAFGTLGLNRVQAVTRTTNEASQKSLQSLGFAKEGTLREYWRVEDKPVTTNVWSLLRNEYGKEKAA